MTSSRGLPCCPAGGNRGLSYSASGIPHHLRVWPAWAVLADPAVPKASDLCQRRACLRRVKWAARRCIDQGCLLQIPEPFFSYRPSSLVHMVRPRLPSKGEIDVEQQRGARVSSMMFTSHSHDHCQLLEECGGCSHSVC